MPDPTLSAWIGFLTKGGTIVAVFISGLFYVFNGVMGIKQMRGEVTELVIEVGELKTNMDQLVLSDSLEKIEDAEFRTEIRCAVGMLVEGETPGYNDCPPNREGETEQ